ncbi:transcriptional adapter 2-alpha [Anaeramoeba flamelloides]|uniref:Transcriptional adapter 2-alpha n=1 Tax=Anaeramoeba flamelloides TaxID=1746091 RepID=A0AAV7ZXQ7_9EUKA|nr:transcriptional adapter 2-alpha [Anaeramoeba flamelloides]
MNDFRFHCMYCEKDLSKSVIVKCAVCENVFLCPRCFSRGKQLYSHKSNHSYQIFVSAKEPIYQRKWIYDEEIKLLEGLERSGLGNWEDVSKVVETKTKEECQQHFEQVYLKSRTFPFPSNSTILSSINKNSKISPRKRNHSQEIESNKKLILSTDKHEERIKKKNSFKKKKKKKKKNLKPRAKSKMNFGDLNGFMPKREDFELLYENDSEKNIEFFGFLDDKISWQLKYPVLESYNLIIEEREKKKNFAIKMGLVNHIIKKNKLVNKTFFQSDKKIEKIDKKINKINSKFQKYNKNCNSKKKEKGKKMKIKKEKRSKRKKSKRTGTGTGTGTGTETEPETDTETEPDTDTGTEDSNIELISDEDHERFIENKNNNNINRKQDKNDQDISNKSLPNEKKAEKKKLIYNNQDLLQQDFLNQNVFVQHKTKTLTKKDIQILEKTNIFARCFDNSNEFENFQFQFLKEYQLKSQINELLSLNEDLKSSLLKKSNSNSKKKVKNKNKNKKSSKHKRKLLNNNEKNNNMKIRILKKNNQLSKNSKKIITPKRSRTSKRKAKSRSKIKYKTIIIPKRVSSLSKSSSSSSSSSSSRNKRSLIRHNQINI